VATEDTTTIGTGHDAMMRSVAAKPSTFGISISIVTRSGLSRHVISIASRPSRASPMTSIDLSSRSILTIKVRTESESSATSTRIMMSSLAAGKGGHGYRSARS
jgi:hypothetical protein